MLDDLTYRLVIIDDESTFYDDYVDAAREFLENKGFLLEPEKQMDRLDQLEKIDVGKIDLFLADLMLGKGDVKGGQLFIEKIREKSLADILFYSTDEKAIRNYKSSSEFDMQKVYFAIRDENYDSIEDRMIALLEESIKRANTPMATRGAILGCVAELDTLVKQKEDELLDGLEDEDKYEQILNKCIRIYYDSYKRQQKKRNDYFGNDFCGNMDKWENISRCRFNVNISDMIRNISITDSSKNLNVLQKTYEIINGKDETYALLKKVGELLDARNILAHVEQEFTDGVYRFRRNAPDGYLELTEEKCIELRKDIIQAYKCIESL